MRVNKKEIEKFEKVMTAYGFKQLQYVIGCPSFCTALMLRDILVLQILV